MATERNGKFWAVDSAGNLYIVNPVTLKSNITDLGVATQSENGLLSAADKKKLDGMTESADAVSVSRSITSGTKIGTITINGTAYDLYTPAADAAGAAATALNNAKSYTDTAIANLINSAPTTLDTLGEIATAMEENADVVEALETSIGTKANISDLTSHTGNTTVHITAAERTNWNSAKTKIDATNVAWGTCSTAAATAEKVITISGNSNWALTAGAIIAVKFSATNTAANPTLNVNGTGAKPVWYSTAAITTSSLSYAGYANRPCFYVYDGTNFVFLGWSYDANTTYTNVKLGHGYATCSTAAATAAKVGTLSSYTLTTGGIVAVKFTYAVPANATLNINSKGAKAIYHRGAEITAGVINAGDTATFIYNGSYYHLLSVDSEITNIISMQSTITSLENRIAALEEKLAYFVGADSTGVYIRDEEG